MNLKISLARAAKDFTMTVLIKFANVNKHTIIWKNHKVKLILFSDSQHVIIAAKHVLTVRQIHVRVVQTPYYIIVMIIQVY